MTDSTQTTLKESLKNTLNLPKTSFPMRANLAQNEPQTLKHWDAIDLYSQIVDSNKDSEPFVFHDGPPYANGSIHVGHLLNKVLKNHKSWLKITSNDKMSLIKVVLLFTYWKKKMICDVIMMGTWKIQQKISDDAIMQNGVSIETTLTYY